MQTLLCIVIRSDGKGFSYQIHGDNGFLISLTGEPTSYKPGATYTVRWALSEYWFIKNLLIVRVDQTHSKLLRSPMKISNYIFNLLLSAITTIHSTHASFTFISLHSADRVTLGHLPREKKGRKEIGKHSNENIYKYYKYLFLAMCRIQGEKYQFSQKHFRRFILSTSNENPRR